MTPSPEHTGAESPTVLLHTEAIGNPPHQLPASVGNVLPSMIPPAAEEAPAPKPPTLAAPVGNGKPPTDTNPPADAGSDEKKGNKNASPAEPKHERTFKSKRSRRFRLGKHTSWESTEETEEIESSDLPHRKTSREGFLTRAGKAIGGALVQAVKKWVLSWFKPSS